jgi:hypothetical protein
MDVAALVISIFAVLLSVIVAGWSVRLQLLMFRATTDQLMAIGKENASLAERIAKSLGQLHEAATSTRSSLDKTIDQLLSAVLSRSTAPASSEAGGAEVGESQPGPEERRVQRAVMFLRTYRSAPVILGELAGGFIDVRTLGTERARLRAETGDDEDIEGVIHWAMDVAAVLAVLHALDLLAFGPGRRTVTLTAEGKQLAALLLEAADD